MIHKRKSQARSKPNAMPNPQTPWILCMQRIKRSRGQRRHREPEPNIRLGQCKWITVDRLVSFCGACFPSGHGSTAGGGAYVAVSVDSACMKAIRSLQNEIKLYSRRNTGLGRIFDRLYPLCAIWRVGAFLSRALESGRNKGQDHARGDAGHGHGASCTAIGTRAVG